MGKMKTNDALLEKLKAEAFLWEPSPLTKLLNEAIKYIRELEEIATEGRK